MSKDWNFEGPRGLAFDSDGNIWVTDVRKSMFSVYEPKGQLLLGFGAGTSVTHPLAIAFPGTIWIDESDKVYVGDLIGRRIQIWQYFSEAYKMKSPLSEEEKKRQYDLLKKQAPRQEK